MSNQINSTNNNLDVQNLKENQMPTEENENKDYSNDIEDMLPFFPILNQNCKLNVPLVPSKKQYEQNIPLLVKHIQQLQIDNESNTKFKKWCAFGIRFQTVTVYGNCFQNNRDYILLDDGTGTILMKYCKSKDCSAIKQLRIELNNRIYTVNKTKNSSEMELNSSLNRLLMEIENRTVKEKLINNGTRACIIGTPFILRHNSEIALKINEMNVDNGQDRDKELFFKRDLIRFYTTYLKKEKS